MSHSGNNLSAEGAPGLDAKSGLKPNPPARPQNQPTTPAYHARAYGDGAVGLVSLLVVNIQIVERQIIPGLAEASR